MDHPAENPETWRRCNSCKKPISYRSLYWVCNVSTCNRKRTGLAFCSVSCWDAHVPMMHHRAAGAGEGAAPSAGEPEAERGEEAAPRTVSTNQAAPAASTVGTGQRPVTH